ncbi:MAG: caspase domain-containing protein [Rhodomicrobium sp.]
MRRWLLAILLFSLFVLGVGISVGPASAGFVRTDVPNSVEGKRVALVIGNADYKNSPQLENTRNDAKAVADALNRFGFQTTLRLDVTKAGFLSTLREFRDQARGAELAIMFYSGSGIAVDETSYLVPVDHSALTDKAALLPELVPASALAQALDTVRGPKLIILDNCREDPFAPKETTARSHQSSVLKGIATGLDRNLMVAYSTRYGGIAADGPPGGNSPYTENLIKILNEPGLEARIALDRVRDAVYSATNGQQDPNTEGTFGSKLVFINPKLAEKSLKSSTTSDNKIEEASKAFALIKDTTSPAMLESFSKLFPDTIYAEFARVRAEELRKELVVTAPVPSAAHSPKRRAFVVGIKTYDNLPPDKQLTKSINDARSIAAILKEDGFEAVKPMEDIDRRTFNLRWQEFVQSVQPGDEVVFYFSGHGVEAGGLNYLVPRDVPRFREGQDQLLKSESINFSELQNQLAQRGPKMSLFILDACRDNPFDETGTKSLGGQKGLRPVTEVNGTFVMFAAGYHQSALDRLNDLDSDPNSVYTRRLLPLAKKKGLRLQDLAFQVREEVVELAMTANHTQVPAYYDQLRGKFCLAGCEQ